MPNLYKGTSVDLGLDSGVLMPRPEHPASLGGDCASEVSVEHPSQGAARPWPTHLSLSQGSLSISAPKLTLSHLSQSTKQQWTTGLERCVPGPALSACGVSDFPPKYFS